MTLLATVGSVVAVTGGAIGIITGLAALAWYVIGSRRTLASGVRDDALGLAAIRGQKIDDLDRDLRLLKEKVAQLEKQLEEATDALARQATAFARSLRELLRTIDRQLAKTPPDVAQARGVIRETLGHPPLRRAR